MHCCRILNNLLFNLVQFISLVVHTSSDARHENDTDEQKKTPMTVPEPINFDANHQPTTAADTR